MMDSWSLYNSKTKEMRENVSLAEMRALLQGLSVEDQRFWFAWNGTRDNWEPALDIMFEITRPNLQAKNMEPLSDLKFVEMEYQAFEKSSVPTIDLSEPENPVISISRVKAPTPSSLQLGSATKQIPMESHEPPKSGFDRRRYPRYHARFRVIIKNENLTFRTFSMDVSLGGLSIETAVPPGCVGSTCQISIGNIDTGETLQFAAKLLVAREEFKYFSFTKAPQDHLTRLEKWLQACEPLKRSG